MGTDCARPRPAARGPARCRAGNLRPPRPAGTRVRVRPAPHLVTTTVVRRSRATPGGLVPAIARPPARGHPGLGARPKVGQQACGAARCHRTWTLDSTNRLLHIQVCTRFERLNLLYVTWRASSGNTRIDQHHRAGYIPHLMTVSIVTRWRRLLRGGNGVSFRAAPHRSFLDKNQQEF